MLNLNLNLNLSLNLSLSLSLNLNLNLSLNLNLNELIFAKIFLLKHICFWLVFVCALASCQTIDVYEKSAWFKEHNWQSNERPSFTFDIGDTSALYNIFFVIRHEDAYNYNNIWVNLAMKSPKDVVTIRREFILGNNKQGWLGSGMDDIFEHRIPFNDRPATLHKGTYTFTLQQDMREDPLEHIINVGIRVEKVR